MRGRRLEHPRPARQKAIRMEVVEELIPAAIHAIASMTTKDMNIFLRFTLAVPASANLPSITKSQKKNSA